MTKFQNPQFGELVMSQVVNGVVKQKKTNVDVAVFVQEWMKEVENDGCYTAVAERLGLKPASAYQRAQNLNKQLRQANKNTLPSLPEKQRTESRRRLDLDSIAALIVMGKPVQEDADDDDDFIEGGITGPVEL